MLFKIKESFFLISFSLFSFFFRDFFSLMLIIMLLLLLLKLSSSSSSIIILFSLFLFSFSFSRIFFSSSIRFFSSASIFNIAKKSSLILSLNLNNSLLILFFLSFSSKFKSFFLGKH